MADFVDLPGQILETRYAIQHVGGSFDAKNLPKPKTLPKALEDARWTKYTGSLYLIGFDSTPYPGKPDFRIGKPEPIGSGLPGNYLPAPFRPIPLRPFGPLIDAPPIPIFWNTDPDGWNGDDIDRRGQTFWNS